jgi:spore coat protein U-like protein
MKTQLAAALALAAFGFAVSANAATSPATATFQVLMKINKACTVTAGAASNIQIGAVAGVDSNSGANSGNSTISVTCSKTTPYFIGLAPSAANGGTNNATGNMISTTAPATNTDKVPYTLYQDAAFGTIWGNTATSSAAGNGKGGTGSGSAQSLTVYAQAPSANFTPDSYADTVTVNVNF